MLPIKQIILWSVLVVAMSPLAFILLPVVAVLAIVGAIALFVDQLTSPRHQHIHPS